MRNYLAFIGDVIDSKQVKYRSELQEALKHAFKAINEQYPELIISKFTLTLGDEFQALLVPSKQVFEVIDHLERLIPVPFRYGMGYGTLMTDYDEEISIGADGPAFWHAREAIDHIHDQNWSGKTNGYVVTKDEMFDQTLNNLLLLSDTLKSEWTDLQKYTFEKMISNGIYSTDFNQKKFASILDVSQSSLSKRLNKGNIKIYLHTRHTMGKLLEGFDESTK